MKVTSEAMDSITVVRIQGNLDTGSSPDAQETINSLISDGASRILVSLAEVDFVASSGLRILLATAKKLGATGGSLRISNLNEVVREVFEMSGFSTILNVYETEAKAMEGF